MSKPDPRPVSADFYQHLFADAERAGVHHLPQGKLDELVKGAGAAGCAVLHADLARVHNKEAMLAAVAKALRFPSWFGANLDALADSLADMGWLPAEGYVVILDHCDAIHGRAEPDFVAMLQVFQDAAEEWREQNVPLWCLVDMHADGIAWLPDINRAE